MTTTPEEAPPVRVRQAERADLLAVLRIERASFPTPWPYEAFGAYLGEPGFLVAVGPASVDPPRPGPVVGYVVTDVIRTYGRPLGHVKNLAVHPDRRGEGVGSALLAESLAVMAEAESVKLEVRESNDGARSLYRRFGFESLRRVEGYYEDGEDAVVMIRETA